MKSPLGAVKERFGDKEKLVAAVESLAKSDLWLDRVNDAKGLSRVSNAKLMRLHSVLSDASKEFGSRAKLVDEILGLENRAKDAGLRARLEGQALPRLMDTLRAARRRAANKKRTPAPPKAKKVVRSRKAQAKASAVKA